MRGAPEAHRDDHVVPHDTGGVSGRQHGEELRGARVEEATQGGDHRDGLHDALHQAAGVLGGEGEHRQGPLGTGACVLDHQVGDAAQLPLGALDVLHALGDRATPVLHQDQTIRLRGHGAGHREHLAHQGAAMGEGPQALGGGAAVAPQFHDLGDAQHVVQQAGLVLAAVLEGVSHDHGLGGPHDRGQSRGGGQAAAVGHDHHVEVAAPRDHLRHQVRGGQPGGPGAEQDVLVLR